MAVAAVWAAALIMYGLFAGTAMGPVPNGVLPLDMAPDSVDDMYRGCKDKMRSQVQKYLSGEKKKDKNFNLAWNDAAKKNSPTALRKELAMAIYIYSLDQPNIYTYFNNAVRSQKPTYKTKFSYHTLHFLLTDALQTLKAHNKGCVTGYRGVNKAFSQDVLNKDVRFGSFTSTTTAGYAVTKQFGDKSCFEVQTCHGADISSFSKFKNEAEVLVPPYEVFRVTHILKRSAQKNLPCEVIYKLKSVGTLSKLNCALFPK